MMEGIRNVLVSALLVCSSVTADAQHVLDIMKNMYSQPEHVCQLLLAGHGDSIVALGDERFKAMASPDMFNGIVPMLERQFGKFQKAEVWTSVSEEQSVHVYMRNLVFEHYSIPLVVSFDANNELAGLVFRAPQVIDGNPIASNEREVTIGTDGLKMPGRITLPADGKGRHPCCILVHGSGPGNMNEAVGGHKPFLDLANGLSKRGIAVIRYDKRTFTHKANYVPAGKKEDYDTETVDDALSAVALARGMDEVCADSIYIIGYSLGAMLAPRIAERSGKGVAGIIAMAAPARKMRELLVDQISYLTDFSSDSVGSQADALIASLPETYLKMDSVYSPVAVARSLDIPMFFMQGERDYQVTKSDFDIWNKEIGGRNNISMKLYPRLNHLFTEGEGASTPDEYNEEKHIPDYVYDDIVSFVKNGRIR